MDFKKHSTLNFQESRYNNASSPDGATKRYYFDDTLPLTKQSLTKKRKQPSQDFRLFEVQRNNRLLLNKITEIMGKPKRQFYSEVKKKQNQKKSLNAGYQRKVCQQIEIENAKILERIMKTKSQYDYGNKNVSRIDKITRKIKIRKVPNIGRYSTNPEHHQREGFRLERTLKLNNTKINVKIYLSQQGLFIEGITNSGIIKVIEIPREEALEFIASECNSKLENIFELLSYSNSTLYLKGGELGMEENKRVEDQGGRYFTEGGEYEEMDYRHVQHSSQLPSIHMNQQLKEQDDFRLSI